MLARAPAMPTDAAPARVPTKGRTTAAMPAASTAALNAITGW